MSKTVDRIMAIIDNGMAEDSLSLRVHRTVAAELARWKGKKITARVASNLEKATGWTVYYDRHIPFLASLRIWGGDTGRTVSNRLECFLGYPDSGELESFDPALFEERDACNGRAAEERNNKRAGIKLRGDAFKMARKIDELNDAIAAVNKALGESHLDNPDIYEMQKLIAGK